MKKRYIKLLFFLKSYRLLRHLYSSFVPKRNNMDNKQRINTPEGVK